MIRKISAHYVFPISAPPLKFGIIIFNSQGQILELIERKDDFREIEALEFYDGILIPGFIKQGTLTDQQLFESLKLQFQKQENLRFDNMFETNIFDSFEISLSPGINLISRIDFANMRLTADSQLKVLVSSTICQP
jgi:hypothetical protein